MGDNTLDVSQYYSGPYSIGKQYSTVQTVQTVQPCIAPAAPGSCLVWLALTRPTVMYNQISFITRTDGELIELSLQLCFGLGGIFLSGLLFPPSHRHRCKTLRSSTFGTAVS